jgi:hypothetical protein
MICFCPLFGIIFALNNTQFKQFFSMTPSQLVQHFRDNQNGNKTLKTTFRNQFLGKFEFEELEGLIISCEKEIEKRAQVEIDHHIAWLEAQGYTVTK